MGDAQFHLEAFDLERPPSILNPHHLPQDVDHPAIATIYSFAIETLVHILHLWTEDEDATEQQRARHLPRRRRNKLPHRR